MTTERDVYELDTRSAVEGLRAMGRAYLELGSEVEKAKKEQESLAEVIKSDLTSAFSTAQAQWNLLKNAFSTGIDLVKEGAQAYLAEEVALTRLNFVLRQSGADAEKYTEKLHAQAEAIERTTGTSSEHILAAQTMALTMGISADQVERFTRVSFNLANLHNQDVIPVMRTLARAHAEGKDELKKFGIVMENITDDAGGFAAVMNEAEKRTAGFSEQLPQAIKDSNQLKKEWEDLWKVIGSGSITFATNLRNALIGNQAALDALNKGKEAVANLGQAAGFPPEQSVFPVDLGTISVRSDADKAEDKRRADLHKKYLAEREREEREFRDEGIQADMEYAAKEFDTWGKAEAEQKQYYEDLGKLSDTAVDKKNEEAQAAADADARQEEAHAQSLMRKKAQEEAFYESMVAQAKDYANQLLQVGFNAIEEELLANTQFNREMFDLQVERETAGMSEVDATAKRAEMEAKIRDDKIASFEKELAASLAAMAKDAAIKAIWEGASAVASAASYEYEAAAQHGIAAALFAGVAVTAGGAAYAINSSRGMTADEGSRLEDARKNEKERKTRDAKQSAQRGEEAGAQVTVIYMGIAGTTELEQGRELDRIRGKWNSLKTGSK